MKGSEKSPPVFGWDDWYNSVGGRSIHIAEVDAILHEIKDYQYPKFKGSVVTDMPLTIDSPIDAGIAAFCDTCKACRRYCPANAIPDKRSPEAGKDHLGNDRYKVDTGKCFPYFAAHNYCSICQPVCVYHHKEWAKDFEGFTTKLFPSVALKEPPKPTDPDIPKHWYPKINR